MIDNGLIVKDWRFIDLTFGLIYPNSYKLMNSSYTIRLLYHMINSKKEYVCERICVPDKIKYPANRDTSSVNQIRSIENKILPIEFDVLGFSVHYENDFKNILWMLEKAEIPLKQKERIKQQEHNNIYYPLIIGGGPVITSNPLPLSQIFDVFFIGDSEPNLIPFLDKVIEWKSEEYNVINFFNKIKEMNGIFIPLLNNHPKREILKNLDESPNPIIQTISNEQKDETIFERNFFVEINRGCPFQCKFCISSFHNSPFRNRNFDKILQLTDEAVQQSKFEKISLIGSCVSSHPKFKEICEYIIKKGKKLSIPSIRLEHLTQELIAVFEAFNMKTITIAPETGSESLRFEIGKKISNEKILEVANNIRKSKIRNIKFYFLLGLPSESDSDVDAIINLIYQLAEIGFEQGTLKVNVNPFIPKFNTPYETYVHNYLDDNIGKFNIKFRKLEKELKKIPSVKLKFQYPKTIIKNAKLQTLFSLGDSSITNLLIKYYQYGANFSDFNRAEKELVFSSNEYLLKIQDGFKPWII